jgi:hypothetical protein
MQLLNLAARPLEVLTSGRHPLLSHDPASECREGAYREPTQFRVKQERTRARIDISDLASSDPHSQMSAGPRRRVTG